MYGTGVLSYSPEFLRTLVLLLKYQFHSPVAGGGVVQKWGMEGGSLFPDILSSLIIFHV